MVHNEATFPRVSHPGQSQHFQPHHGKCHEVSSREWYPLFNSGVQKFLQILVHNRKKSWKQYDFKSDWLILDSDTCEKIKKRKKNVHENSRFQQKNYSQTQCFNLTTSTILKQKTHSTRCGGVVFFYQGHETSQGFSCLYTPPPSTHPMAKAAGLHFAWTPLHASWPWSRDLTKNNIHQNEKMWLTIVCFHA